MIYEPIPTMTYGQALDWMFANPGKEVWASGVGYLCFKGTLWFRMLNNEPFEKSLDHFSPNKREGKYVITGSTQ